MATNLLAETTVAVQSTATESSANAEWWRWGESNPRPPKRHNSFYVCSLPLRSRLRDCQQTGPSRTPATCWVSLLRPAARRWNYPAVVVFILSAGVRGKTSSLYLGCECVLFVGTYCFCRRFNEANRHPRLATSPCRRPRRNHDAPCGRDQ